MMFMMMMMMMMITITNDYDVTGVFCYIACILSYCLSNALHSNIGQNIKSLACLMSDVRSQCEKCQMAITQ